MVLTPARRQFARELLVRSVRHLESQANRRSLNVTVIEALIGIARLIGSEEVLNPLVWLWRTEKKLAGRWWLELPYEALRPVEALDQEYRERHDPYPAGTLPPTLGPGREGHIGLAFARRFEEALVCAGEDPLCRDDVIMVQAVLGDFDGALANADAFSGISDTRQIVRVVIAIEAGRDGQWERFREMIDALAALESNEQHWIYVLLGLMGLSPWGGYPFADY